MYIRAIGIINQLFIRDSYTQIKFSKKWSSWWQNVNSLWWVHFLLPIQICLNIGFCLNVLFWFIVLWTKKRSSSFFKKDLVFQKTFFEVNILKTFKIPCDCHIKPFLSFKRRAFLKIPRIDFYRSTRSFYWLQNKTSAKKCFSVLRRKPLTFCCKFG